MGEELFQLIHKAKRGDRTAFAELVKKYKGPVFRHAYAMVNDRMEAEDIAQEAFIKAYYSLAKLEHEYAFASWMTRIVSNLCHDRLKKLKKQRIVNIDQVQGTQTSSIDESELKLTIQEAMQRLSPSHREALVLRDIQGFAYDEIAEQLKIPLGTVKSRINIARRELKIALSRGEENG
ncbi:MAG TPA: sigma-70 family RNA polymerase sigma factor [Bacillales bacterium]